MFLLLFMFGLLVYSNNLNNKFLIDDYRYLNKPSLSMRLVLYELNPYRLQPSAFLGQQDITRSYYRPLTYMLYDFYYPAFKNNLWRYHLLSIFLYVFMASLIYLALGRISGNYNLAFLTSLFYLIHPINGIAVNYISAVVCTLEAIFMLGAILLLWES